MRILIFSWLTLLLAVAEAAPADVQALIAEGKFSQALSRVEADLARDADSVELQFLRGIVLTRMNRLDAAAQVFQRITELHPELPEPYNNLAVVHAARGDYDAAQEALLKAIRTHPSYATAHENLGDIYARMASEAYSQALQLDESNKSAQTKLALINDLFPVPPVSVATTAAGQPQGDASGAVAAASAPEPVQEPAPAPAPAPAPVPAPEVTTAALPAAKSGAGTAPAAAPEASPADRPAVAEDAEIRSAVEAWAAAWSAQDVDAYLSAYGPEFDTPDGMSRQAWEAQRRARVSRPGRIRVTLADIRVLAHGPDHVQVKFRQRYESDAFTDTVRKTLLMKRTGSGWKIVGESLR